MRVQSRNLKTNLNKDTATLPPSRAFSIQSQVYDVENSNAEHHETNASRPRISQGLLLASQNSTARLTPPGSPPSHSSFASPKRTSRPLSPRRHSQFSGLRYSEKTLITMTTNIEEDQRKRTLDALERRFALAEAELFQQQQKGKRKRPLENKAKVTTSITNASVHPIPTNCASVLPPTNPSPKTDLEANDPTYFLLSHPVHENLASTSSKISNKKGSIADKILHELLQNGDSAQKYMQGSRGRKIDNWVLLDNLVQGQGSYSGARIKSLKNHSKRSKKHMSMKQHKKFGSLTLPEDFHNFETYKPMHEMWQGYIMQLLKNVGRNQLAQCLLSADLHGAIILVVQSKIPSFTGVSGIMIRETAETFAIITHDNKLRVVPKKASVFMLQADCWKITLLGDKLSSRNMGP